MGRTLLEDACRRGARTLWCFVHNAGALRFYARHGAVVDPASASGDKAEGLPAVRLILPVRDELRFVLVSLASWW